MGLRRIHQGIGPLPRIASGILIAIILSSILAACPAEAAQCPAKPSELDVTAKVAMYMLCSISSRTSSPATGRLTTDAERGASASPLSFCQSNPGACLPCVTPHRQAGLFTPTR